MPINFKQSYEEPFSPWETVGVIKNLQNPKYLSSLGHCLIRALAIKVGIDLSQVPDECLVTEAILRTGKFLEIYQQSKEGRYFPSLN